MVMARIGSVVDPARVAIETIGKHDAVQDLLSAEGTKIEVTDHGAVQTSPTDANGPDRGIRQTLTVTSPHLAAVPTTIGTSDETIAIGIVTEKEPATTDHAIENGVETATRGPEREIVTTALENGIENARGTAMIGTTGERLTVHATHATTGPNTMTLTAMYLAVAHLHARMTIVIEPRTATGNGTEIGTDGESAAGAVSETAMEGGEGVAEVVRRHGVDHNEVFRANGAPIEATEVPRIAKHA